ncbi:MAG: ComEC/Rec2 family competence protein [Patescibacteria group bacterium]
MKRKHKYFFVAALFTAACIIWWEVIRAERSTLIFWALNIGQGDALFIETPSKNQVLIDAGPSGKNILGELGDVMPFYDKSIDLAVLTHPHLDHVGGFPAVLKSYRLNAFAGSGDPDTLAEYKETQNILEEKAIPFYTARRGQKIILDRNVWLEILHPMELVESKNIHRNMVVVMLHAGEKKFLLMGDAEGAEEVFLVEHDRDKLKSDILKAGHHGSKTSSRGFFLERVKPQYAVISAGRKNKYGHPHEETLQNLQKIGTTIFRTDLDGRIKIETDGRELKVSASR